MEIFIRVVHLGPPLLVSTRNRILKTIVSYSPFAQTFTQTFSVGHHGGKCDRVKRQDSEEGRAAISTVNRRKERSGFGLRGNTRLYFQGGVI